MTSTQYLSEEEIDEFVEDLDRDSDGFIDYDEVEAKLDEVHDEIAPEPKPHNLNHDSTEGAQRHAFLKSVMGTEEQRISRADFSNTVRSWNVPSLDPDKQAEQDHDEYMKSMSWGRRLRAYWSVEGREVMFIALVIALQIAFGTWQLVEYLSNITYRNAFGWGIVFAKTCAGILYPTLFFLILSMSRYLSAVARKSYFFSRLINWDKAQSFHIIISIVALGFGTLHAIGHLTGSFLYSSRPAQRGAAITAVGQARSYRQYVALIPGWSGVAALGLFWIMALLSMPIVRKRSYELFQLGHLLMFLIIGLLCAHGAAGLFQYPMLGFWLAFPTFLVVFERAVRIGYGFHFIPAILEVLDSETVAITVTVPQYRYWKYRAGQYVLITVPKLSLFQWHPFTISTCIGNEMQVHIKTDGNWSSKLRAMAGSSGKQQIKICLDGPFGAPAQRFYEFDNSIILGSGIGVTPFSGILTDLQAREDRQLPDVSPSSSTTWINGEKPRKQSGGKRTFYRQVDFHWIVKDKNHLLWFSDLLNSISKSALTHHSDEIPHLDIRIQTHVTQKRKCISTHVYRYLLEIHRTDTHPESPLTGLLNPTRFGRPDLGKIMNEHYESMLKTLKETGEKGIERTTCPICLKTSRTAAQGAEQRRIRYVPLLHIFLLPDIKLLQPSKSTINTFQESPIGYLVSWGSMFNDPAMEAFPSKCDDGIWAGLEQLGVQNSRAQEEYIFEFQQKEIMSADHGKCHCGEVEWKVKLEDRAHILCHCDTCKTLGGGSYTLNQVVPKENLNITKGSLKTYTYYGDSGKAVICYYCPNCTTHIYHHQTVMGDDKIVVRTILLDQGKSIQPGLEIYGKARLPWVKEVAHTFESVPPM
ncbi:hypothetical protein G7Y89_g6177 [Cudoniella acicularis]|uniref:Uncharacterized protein n=1 Tax=Cudoniella acicularis TaxID=354080 RepID=A0A8H4RMF2_9HELO|nr:hypothetical protein G7Y89_g6177 [Cudoniella acicularis]